MEITNIVKTYNARKGNTTVEWRIGQDGKLLGLSAQIYGESGEYAGNCSVSQDGSRTAYAASGASLSAIASELEEIMAWIGDHNQEEEA